MPRYNVPLTAGKPERVPYPGKLVQLVDLGAAATIDTTIEWKDQSDTERLGALEQYFRMYSATDAFTGLEFTSAVDTVLDILVSQHDMSVNRSDGSTVTITGTANVAVTGTAATLEKQTTAMTPVAATAVNNVLTPLLAADATRLRAVFANLGTDPVALGSAALTWANRVIVINPGDTWVETDAAGVAWYAICDVAKTASVTIQERR